VIAELIDFLARGGESSDPAMDATLLFRGVPPGVAVDGTFRRIRNQVYETKRSIHQSDLRDLPKVLCKLYDPQARAERSASVVLSDGTAHDPLTTQTPAASSDKLRRRLGRMSSELARANERIAALEADNARLRAENAELRAGNAELRIENRSLRAENARLTSEANVVEAVHSAELEALRD
jgi:predicted RNase H-like nuclease (RuvC/YqgF family)